jgi:4-hydroxythreonine-4-phosphate dehydrogenase
LKKVAISIGDPNGIGLQIALEAHNIIKKIVKPIYCVDKKLLAQASDLLNIPIPKDFKVTNLKANLKIKPSKITKKSGAYSYNSFLQAINLAKNKKVDAIITLPISKEAWAKAGIKYVGHTDMLRDIFQKDAIMMLGCKKLFVALYTEHIPLKEVPKHIKYKKLVKFLLDFKNSISYNKPIPLLAPVISAVLFFM